MHEPARLEQLRAEARFHREKHDLYKAKVGSGRATTLGRLRDLEHARTFAEQRLRQAESDARA